MFSISGEGKGSCGNEEHSAENGSLIHRLGIQLGANDPRKMAIAVFFVAIMIGAAMFVAFHELPRDKDTGDGGNVLVWDMNIYKEREETYRYTADALSLLLRFPDSPQMNNVLLKNRDVEVRYEVEDLLFGPSNGQIIMDREGQVSGNMITYGNVFDNVDLVYIV